MVPVTSRFADQSTPVRDNGNTTARILKEDRTWHRYWAARRSRTPLVEALAA
jgi:hypothetical protein